MITPAVGAGVVDAEMNTTALWLPKLARFRRLKNSARKRAETWNLQSEIPVLQSIPARGRTCAEGVSGASTAFQSTPPRGNREAPSRYP